MVHSRGANQVEVEATDFLSRIFQHETDHLSGILFIDKLGPIGRLAARQNLARLEAEYRDAQSMGEIPPDSELIQRLEALADGGSTPS